MRVDDEEVCAHHQETAEPGWAETNRVMCDLLHRGRAPVRLSVRDRDPLDLDGPPWGGAPE
jgi:hypothetical protein